MLFRKECRKILFSLTFILYFAAVLAMYFTQFHSDFDIVYAPQAEQEDYGMMTKEVPEVLMPSAIESLVGEYLSGNFTAYPFGFYKNVRLNEKKKQKLGDIVAEVSGISIEILNHFTDYEEGGYFTDENGEMTYIEPVMPEINIPAELTYAHFRELMQEADEIIGGGSRYSDEFIVSNFSLLPKTYEDAFAEYEDFLNRDKITGAYARLYCDYMGIVLAILPVFVAISLTALDRKSRMEQLAYSRKISSVKLIFTRFAALIAVMLLPVILTAVIAQHKINGMYSDSNPDQFAMLKYMFIWLLPNVMTASAVGMLMTELTSSMLAIFAQGVWWFMSIFSGTGALTGSIGKFTLVLRHNSLYKREAFMSHYDDFIFNRIFFTVISLVIIVLTIWIYEQKRRGIFNGYAIRINLSSHQSEA